MNDRLQQLRAELEKGRRRMHVLDHEREQVRETMLRISGAIQVLEELMEQEDHASTETQLATVA